MAPEQFSLVLGCGGYTYNNIELCSGTHNVIIDFNHHLDATTLQKIMDFLDFACGLFDRPMGDWNKVINTLKLLREQHNLIDDNIWEALHAWIPRHKQCGGFLRLALNTDIESIFSKSAQVLVQKESIKYNKAVAQNS